jgi:hypothetical protein
VISTSGSLQTAWSPDTTRLLVYEVVPEPIASKSLSIFSVSSGSLTKSILPVTFEIFDLLGWQP